MKSTTMTHRLSNVILRLLAAFEQPSIRLWRFDCGLQTSEYVDQGSVESVGCVESLDPRVSDPLDPWEPRIP